MSSSIASSPSWTNHLQWKSLQSLRNRSRRSWTRPCSAPSTASSRRVQTCWVKCRNSLLHRHHLMPDLSTAATTCPPTEEIIIEKKRFLVESCRNKRKDKILLKFNSFFFTFVFNYCDSTSKFLFREKSKTDFCQFLHHYFNSIWTFGQTVKLYQSASLLNNLHLNYYNKSNVLNSSAFETKF